MKSRAGMEALINDSSTRHLDVLLIQEPPISMYRTHYSELITRFDVSSQDLDNWRRNGKLIENMI
jgi:hypothetical protein